MLYFKKNRTQILTDQADRINYNPIRIDNYSVGVNCAYETFRSYGNPGGACGQCH